MSLFTLPCLYLNLGGEMIIILQQRLEAQAVPGEKQRKVLKDIINHFLHDSVLSTLFTPQPLMTKKRLKTTFTKLAHGSIMKLSPDAMDKLFDLMLMAFKYKVFTCKSGHELLMLTLSHLDDIRFHIDEVQYFVDMVNNMFAQCVEFYKEKMSSAELELVRHTILNFLQDSHKKVSIFLTRHIQLPTGRFVLPHGGTVPFGCEMPGKITYLQKDQKSETVSLSVKYYRIEKEGSLDFIGDRRMFPNVNLYGNQKRQRVRSIDAALSDRLGKMEEEETSSGYGELDLLQHLLIGFQNSPSTTKSFKLTLFEDDDDGDKEPATKPKANIIKAKGVTQKSDSDTTVKISDCKSSEMKLIIDDFDEKTTVRVTDKGDDLLSLMDAL